MKARGFEDELLRDRFLVFVDLIGSKIAPTQVKLLVEDLLGAMASEVVHEPTGNDSYLIVVSGWNDVLQVVQLLRGRVELFVTEEGNGLRGVRVSVAIGDCIARKHERSGSFGMMLTDREGTADIPTVAYQLDSIKHLLDKHDEFKSSDESKGIVVHSTVVERVVRSSEASAIQAAGFTRLGDWEVKGLQGQAFFYRVPRVRS
jgi:hypothetical protein